MITPIGHTNTEQDSGRQVRYLLLSTLRGKEPAVEAAPAETLEEFQQELLRLGKEEHLKIQRASTRPLEEVPPGVRRMAESRARAVLRAGDWVISGRRGERGMEYDLAYGLACGLVGEQVLLALEGPVPLARWQEEAGHYWFVTLTFPRPEKPLRAETLSPVEICWLQRRLNTQLSTKLAVDGEFGPETRAALAQFQEKRRQKQRFHADPLEEELAELLDLTGTPW